MNSLSYLELLTLVDYDFLESSFCSGRNFNQVNS